MGLEVATYISDLVATNPTSSDPKAQGDDHFRLIKAALQATIPYTGLFYETGTFTPGITFGGGSTGVTYSGTAGFRNGEYTRIGRVVNFTLYLVLTSKGSSTGTVAITGLPYAIAAAAPFTAVSVYGNTLATTSGGLMGFINTTSQTIALRYSGTGTATALTDANFTNTSDVMVSGSYRI